MKIVVLDGYAANPGDLSWDGLKALGELEVHEYTAPGDTQSRIADADAVLTNKTVLSREIIENAPKLKYIGVLATGFNIVDVEAAREKGIPVCNVPTYATEAVAQFVFALLLELCHHVGHHNAQVQKLRWTNNRDFCFWDYPLMELQGKTMGLVGLGRIGTATKKLAEAFGMKVLCCRSTPDAPGCVPLETLLRESDVVSLHCPLTDRTRHIINAQTISQMKDGVLIINTGRGPLIDDAALREALLSGKVAGAAVDVASVEPIPADNPLLGLDNCIITPHIAWATGEARRRLMDTVTDNLRSFAEGKPVNVVNP
ncbi:MAG: D-2-hydroxyacid dehydrogenase [Clostridiales bacterium]|nr:D-2-hydroxyacid dehydrogenase [Clostridiales bacterium]